MTQEIIKTGNVKKIEGLSRLMDEFRDQVLNAHQQMSDNSADASDPEYWVEASPEIAKYLYSKGLGEHTQKKGEQNTFFLYAGVLCYLPGTKEAVIQQHNKTTFDVMGDPLEGKDELKV